MTNRCRSSAVKYAALLLLMLMMMLMMLLLRTTAGSATSTTVCRVCQMLMRKSIGKMVHVAIAIIIPPPFAEDGVKGLCLP